MGSVRRRYKPSKPAQRRRKALVDAHLAQNGPICFGWAREAHYSDQLTADHLIPLSKGGSEWGPLRVLCRSCNSRRKGKRDPKAIKVGKTYANPLP